MDLPCCLTRQTEVESELTSWLGDPGQRDGFLCYPTFMYIRLSGIRYRVSGIRYRVSGIRYQVSGIRYQISGIKYRVSGIRYQVPDAGYQVPGLSRRLLSTCRGTGYQVLGLSGEVLARDKVPGTGSVSEGLGPLA